MTASHLLDAAPLALGTSGAARIEDLEEALRRIVVLLEPAGHHDPSDRDWAALAIACDVLDMDPPEEERDLIGLA